MLRILVSLWHVRCSLFSKESKWLICTYDLNSYNDLAPFWKTHTSSSVATGEYLNVSDIVQLGFKSFKRQLLQRCFCWHETQPKLLLKPEVGRAEKPCTSSHLCVSQECSTQIRLRVIVWEQRYEKRISFERRCSETKQVDQRVAVLTAS